MLDLKSARESVFGARLYGLGKRVWIRTSPPGSGVCPSPDMLAVGSDSEFGWYGSATGRVLRLAAVGGHPPSRRFRPRQARRRVEWGRETDLETSANWRDRVDGAPAGAWIR